MSKPKNKAKELFILAAASIVGLSVVGIIITSVLKLNTPVASQETSSKSLQASSLTIGILTNSDNYTELAEYLRSQFGNKVQVIVDGSESISYTEVRDRLVRKEWDITFALSPMLSVAAKENGYNFAARMFADKPPHYQAALFVKSDSPIQSLSDLKPTTRAALGDFNSASSFYMPAYELFGKTLQVDKGHRSREIIQMVKTGKADFGAAAYDTVKDDPGLRVIHVSRQIPGSNVYLSPSLSKLDRQAITKALLDAPASIKDKANYGVGNEPDYAEFIKISRKAEEVLKCADFQRQPVNFFCSSSTSTQPTSNTTNTPDVIGRINGWSRKDSKTEQFNLSAQDNKAYFVVVERSILNQVSSASNPLALQNKEIKVMGVTPKVMENGAFELKITKPDQLIVLENTVSLVSSVSSAPPIQANYQVKKVSDGDTIVVASPTGEEIRVRFACIDTPEVAHSAKEANSTDLGDRNQFLWGTKAKERLDTLIEQGGGKVALAIVDTDRYGRKVAEVRLPDGTFTQEVLIKEGLGMVYRKYIDSCPSASVVEQAEVTAKQQQLNIWADSQFIAPWQWRQDKKS